MYVFRCIWQSELSLTKAWAKWNLLVSKVPPHSLGEWNTYNFALKHGCFWWSWVHPVTIWVQWLRSSLWYKCQGPLGCGRAETTFSTFQNFILCSICWKEVPTLFPMFWWHIGTGTKAFYVRKITLLWSSLGWPVLWVTPQGIPKLPPFFKWRDNSQSHQHWRRTERENWCVHAVEVLMPFRVKHNHTSAHTLYVLNG